MSDLILDDPNVVVTADQLDVRGHDLQLRDAQRMREPTSHQGRRALVHDFQDGLTINYNSDYPGGVTIFDLKVIPSRGIFRPRTGPSPPAQPLNVANEILYLKGQVQVLGQQLAALSARVP